MNGGSTPPQLPPSETGNRSMGGSITPPQLPPNFNIQPSPSFTSTTNFRSVDGTLQLPPGFNLQDFESTERPFIGLKLTITPELVDEVEKATGGGGVGTGGVTAEQRPELDGDTDMHGNIEDDNN